MIDCSKLSPRGCASWLSQGAAGRYSTPFSAMHSAMTCSRPMYSERSSSTRARSRTSPDGQGHRRSTHPSASASRSTVCAGRRDFGPRRLEEGNPERAGDGERDRGGADRDAAHRERSGQAPDVHHDASSDSEAAFGAVHHAAIERKKSTAAPVATRFRSTICAVEVEKNAVKLTLVSMSA